MKVEIYPPLIDGLRPMASRKDLSDVELIREFVFYDLVVDDSCSGECICRKKGLK